MSWIIRVLRGIFCGGIIRDYEELLEECKSQLDSCAKRMKEMLAKISELQVRIVDLVEENQKLKRDVEYWEERAKHLMDALSSAIQIPDISDLLEPREIVKPWTEFDWKGYDFLAADTEYYAFPKENWEKILSWVFMEKEKAMEVWKPEVADCDDHALVMASLVALAFNEAGLDRQGAFFIIWSRSHAYNGFIDDTRRIWIYEPQTNEIVGLLGETTDPYSSRLLWMPEKRVKGKR